MRTTGSQPGLGHDQAGPGQRRYAALGIVASSATREELLEPLQRVPSGGDVRLLRISDAAGIQTLYRVEVALPGPVTARLRDDAWATIKEALASAFPSGRPGAVTLIDP